MHAERQLPRTGAAPNGASRALRSTGSERRFMGAAVTASHGRPWSQSLPSARQVPKSGARPDARLGQRLSPLPCCPRLQEAVRLRRRAARSTPCIRQGSPCGASEGRRRRYGQPILEGAAHVVPWEPDRETALLDGAPHILDEPAHALIVGSLPKAVPRLGVTSCHRRAVTEWSRPAHRDG